MHIRLGMHDLAESGRFEGTMVFRSAGSGEAAFGLKQAVTPGDSGVVELLVGEVGTDMAGDAVGLTAENLKTDLRLCPSIVA